MKPALTLITALLFAPLAALHAADNPFTSAKAVWRMTAEEGAGKQPFAPKENGPVKFEPLGAAEAVESRKSGRPCQWSQAGLAPISRTRVWG